jgi:hypothetical protein
MTVSLTIWNSLSPVSHADTVFWASVEHPLGTAGQLTGIEGKTMNRSKLRIAVIVATACLDMGAIAQTNPPVAPPSGVTQQLQWSGVDLDASQFKGVRDLVVNALRMRLVVDRPNFAVLLAANGSLFKIYGPGSSDRPWRHGQGGLAIGFLTDDIAATLKAIHKSGGVLLGVVNVLPKAGVDGGDYAFQFFRAPDNHVYAIVQNKNYHAH